jgi:2'-5' RNA ligase
MRGKNRMASDKFMIAYLPSKEVSDYVTKLINELAEKFDEKYILENPRPVHVTLKSPFEFEKIEEVELIIEKFVKTQKSAGISTGDFEEFRGKVFFLKTNFSQEAMEIQKELIEQVRVLKEIRIDRYDEEFTPHLTVGYANSQESYDGIVEILEKTPNPDFDFKFDNIALLKKNKNVWEVYKIYEIKP